MLKNSLSILIAFLAVITFIVVTQQNHSYQTKQVKVSLTALKVPPLASDKNPVPDFNKYEDVAIKKEKFFAYLLPEVKRQNQIITAERHAVSALFSLYKTDGAFNKQQQAVFDYLVKKYTVEYETLDTAVFEELLIKVDTVPEALVLVQGAIESGWGTSRFAKKGYNFFGLWCFKEGCGFVPKQRNDGAAHEVAKFKDLSHGVMTYMRNINRLYAYEDLRALRAAKRNEGKAITAEVLSTGLLSYSERGQEYIDELLNMLRVNKQYMGLGS
ncbi:glucosaminidase domain-containing protein [Paraglaciecola sp. 2405UD69-4]|uniref:glucosaminidase domain-containing protein n=1 Tax=Paraglaciecola sp. 2405UD69-4 TaxID=3391836 RepID=UPI0039C9FB18